MFKDDVLMTKWMESKTLGKLGFYAWLRLRCFTEIPDDDDDDKDKFLYKIIDHS